MCNSRDDICHLIIFGTTFVILLFILLFATIEYWKQIIAYLIGINALTLSQAVNYYISRRAVEINKSHFIKNLLNCVYYEIRLFKNDYLDPINTKLNSVIDKPLFENYSVSHSCFSIYYSNIENTGIINNEVKQNIISCHSKLRGFVDLILAHNSLYDEFLKIYIQMSMSIDNLDKCDPTVFPKELKYKYNELTAHTKLIRNNINEINKTIAITIK